MNTERVLVIAAHPDDEALGCAGTLARHRETGDTAAVAFLSEGVSSRYDYNPKDSWLDEQESREKMAVAAAEILDIEVLEFFRLPNLRMDDEPLLDISKLLSKLIENYQPTIIYTHHSGDLNSDHRVAFEATFIATRPHPNLSVKTLRSFEVLSSTEWAPLTEPKHFLPDTYIDITNYIDKKISTIKAYEKEMRQFPHPRSEEIILAQSKLRGSQVGLSYAEAFVTVRNVLK